MLILIAANGCAVSTGESPPQASQPCVEGLQLPAGNPFGVWKLNARRSVNPATGSLIVRSEPHAKGEAFTLDRGGSEGRFSRPSRSSTSTGTRAMSRTANVRGTQSSRRLDSRTVEILRLCAGGWTRLVRRLSPASQELVLEITEQHPDRGRLERLMLEKQASEKQ